MKDRLPCREFILPGGLLIKGSLERQVKFRSLTGRVEQALMELSMIQDRPGYVTAVLTATLDTIGNTPADSQVVKDLCVADRQFLLLRLAELLHGNQLWLEVHCRSCGDLFDVEVKRGDLPIQEAGADFPHVVLQLHGRLLEMRIPTGRDQEQIAEYRGKDPLRLLLGQCIRTVDGVPPDQDYIHTLSADDIEVIDNALNEVSPSVCNQLLVNCPECEQEQRAELDHSSLGNLNNHLFYGEVHTLASNYHWSEKAILELPQERRRLYISMINNSPIPFTQGGSP